MKPLRSVKTSAVILALSPWTVRALIRDGKLKAVRIGRRVLIEEAELERFIAETKKVQENRHQDISAGDSDVAEGLVEGASL